MKTDYRFKTELLRACICCAGMLRGIHLGHQAVIGRAVADKSNGLTPSVFTFQENPYRC